MCIRVCADIEDSFRVLTRLSEPGLNPFLFSLKGKKGIALIPPILFLASWKVLAVCEGRNGTVCFVVCRC